VKREAALESLTGAIIAICRSGLPPDALRARVFSRLRRAVPFDAAFWATVDPATLLFTGPHQEEIPPGTIPYFVQNEFIDDDVNKWTALVRDRAGVRTMAEATAGEMEASPRYRDIFQPLGLGDELRAVLRVGDACWGYLCLHRAAGADFSSQDVRYVRRLAPHLAEAIRAGLLASLAGPAHPDLAAAHPDPLAGPAPLADAPGLVLMAPDGSFISTTAAGERWLDELGHVRPERDSLPTEFLALAATLSRPDTTEAALPRLRIRTRTGRWAALHASRLTTEGTPAIAVIIEAPSPAELAPILMMAYGLSPQEQVITMLVCRGLSTREISGRLYITVNTVQDHLKSIFDKTGVHSRRELVAAILQEQYLPRARTGQPIGPSGFFTE
jgi:DNA-binding CsgD family transcriptional regulator